MIMKYIKIFYVSLISALFIMGISLLLNSAEIPFSFYSFVSMLLISFRTGVTLYYEIRHLLATLKQFKMLRFPSFKISFKKNKYRFYIGNRVEPISIYKLKVIRC